MNTIVAADAGPVVALRPAAAFFCQLLSTSGLSLQVWSATRKGVAQVEEHHIRKRLPRQAGGYRPRVAREIGILPHQVQCAVAGVFPHGLIEAQRAFVNDPVLRRRRPGPLPSVAYRFAGGVDDYVRGHVDPAVIDIEEAIAMGIFETIYGRMGVNSGRAAVGSYDQIGHFAENVTTAAIAVEEIGKPSEAPEQPHIEINEGSGTGCRVLRCIGGIPKLELPLQPA